MACAEPLLELDDQSLALQLQLDDIEALRETRSGKWKEDSPPDFAMAFDEFEAELQQTVLLLDDLKLAHSIAKAIDSDSVAIGEFKAEELQSAQDRQMAVSLNEGEIIPAHEVTEAAKMAPFEQEWLDWDHVLRATEASTPSIVSWGTSVAGPSVPYADRQKAVLERLPQLKVECNVCGDSFHAHLTVSLLCHHIYCKPCLKSFLLRVTKDATLYPPKCCRALVELSIIAETLSPGEMTTYRNAELEFTSTDRIYCADPQCATFIPSPQRIGSHASCEVCKARTCVDCRKLAHDGQPCLPDEATQSLIIFANNAGYQTCFRCGMMVSHDVGCDHMTSRCGAEFCYPCGVQWKNCPCGDWQEDLLQDRAEEIINRENPFLAFAARQQRVAAMAQELLETHECDHSGKFTRFEINSRRGRACEMCGTRHRIYLLSCRRCHILACQDCRGHRM